MGTLSRRSFIRGATSTAFLSRSLPLAGSIALFSPKDARAWVGAALAIGGTVAGMVAAHNQSDGGVGAMLTANLELLKISISKLSDIQDRLTEVYRRLDELSDEIDAMLKRETTRKLQIEMLSVVRGYGEKLQNRDPSQSFEEWKTDALTSSDIRGLLHRLQSARQQINVQNLLDPSTALVAATTGFVETNLQNLLGYRIPEIINTIDNVYLPWLDAILDERQVNSTAWFTYAAHARLMALYEQVLKHELGGRLTLASGASALVACTGAHDYVEDKYVDTIVRCKPVNFQPNGFDRNVVWPINFQTAQGGVCVEAQLVPGRNGPSERLFVNADLTETEYVDNGTPTGVLVFAIQKGAEYRLAAGTDGVPEDRNCDVVTSDLPTPEKRLEAMRSSEARRLGEARFTELSELIAAINLERGRIAYGARTMVACEAARRNLIELKQRYS